MRRQTLWRTFLAVSIACSLTARVTALPGHAAVASIATTSPLSGGGQGGLSAAEVQRLTEGARHHVIIILRDQHAALSARGVMAARHAAAVAADQQPILAELAQLQAPRPRSFHVVNAIAATVSAAEEGRLRSNARVQAVVPDLVLQGPSGGSSVLRHEMAATRGLAPAAPAPPPSTCRTPGGLSLEPEALQQTDTAFLDPSTPQAQTIVTGTGVTVAVIADGIDVNNPDFIRPDGSRVFTDYQDFSGDGPSTPTSGREAFGAASSIAAQGRFIYDVSRPYSTTFDSEGAGVFVNPAYNTPPAPCRLRVLGMAPGASLMGLKAFGANNQSVTSNVVQAIQYAVDHGADVIDESFGSNPYPDPANDPIARADDAAVAAGVTVVARSGDAGTASTIGSPATDPNVIAVGATTQFRFYQQIVYAGFQLGNGDYASNNIAAFSSAGPAQSGRQTVDVVAGGDSSWALCTPDPRSYFACTDNNGDPSRLGTFGGAGESASLTVGEAALVIEAYRQSHGGVRPTPALVKEIVKSTATDLNAPAGEQGAGQIDSLRAVQAALSYKDTNGDPTATRGDAVLVSPDTLAATGQPNTTERFFLHVTNSGAAPESVEPRVETLGPPVYAESFAPPLSPATDATFTHTTGSAQPYVTQPFTVPAAADRLDAAISWNVARNAGGLVNLALVDPQGRYTAYSAPQTRESGSGYGHVDVRNAQPGAWQAVLFTDPAGNATAYTGTVHLAVSASNVVPVGAISPVSRTLAPGESGAFTLLAPTPAQPGDESAQVAISTTNTASGTVGSAGAVPIILRSLVPVPTTAGPSTTAFSGTLTGGNGHSDAPGQTLTYAFDVPPGLADLDLGLALPDSNYNLQGMLVDPGGQPVDTQSTVTTIDGSGTPITTTNTMQFFRRDPQAGRWTFVLLINGTISGEQTSTPFTANVRFDGVDVQAPDMPRAASTALTQGVPVTIPVRVTNTGNTAKGFFVDGRLAQYAPLSLPALGGSGFFTLPFTTGELAPHYLVPSESRQVSIAAESMSPTVPISMDILNENGAPPFGFARPANGEIGAPDIQATSFFDPLRGAYAAVASSSAPEVVPGLWAASPTDIGPYGDAGAPGSTLVVGAAVDTQRFDPAISAGTADPYAAMVGLAQPGGSPLALPPGRSGAITVTITPHADPGTVVHGFLYVDTLQALPYTATTALDPGAYVYGNDELAAVPYTYTVISAAAATQTAVAVRATSTAVAGATNTAVTVATGTAVAAATGTAVAATTGTAVVGATGTAAAAAAAAAATGTAVAAATSTAAAAETASAPPAQTQSGPPPPPGAGSGANGSPPLLPTAPPASTSIAATSTAAPTSAPVTGTATSGTLGRQTQSNKTPPVTKKRTTTGSRNPQPRPQPTCSILSAVFYIQKPTRPLVTVSGLLGGARGATSQQPLVYDDGRQVSFVAQQRYQTAQCGGAAVLRVQGRVAQIKRNVGRVLSITGLYTLTVTLAPAPRKSSTMARYRVLLRTRGFSETVAGVLGRVSVGPIRPPAPPAHSAKARRPASRRGHVVKPHK